MKCPLCGKDNLALVIERRNVPVMQNIICNTFEESINTKRGNIELYKCLTCDFVFNSVYRQVDYDDSYENYQGYSDLFSTYEAGNAARVADYIDSFHESILLVEIGCGQGNFLRQVIDKLHSKQTKAFGFDPSYTGGIHAGDKYLIFSEYF